jgi:hypothetical protein
MQLIFGEERANTLREKYIVLELDMVKFNPIEVTSTVYCVLEKLPETNLDVLNDMLLMHHTMITYYRNRQWSEATVQLDQLTGYWGEDVDTFYNDLRSRIAKYQETDPGEDWSPAIEKTITFT